MDYAHDYADRTIDELETLFKKEYSQAVKEMKKKQAEFMADYAREREDWLKRLDGSPEMDKAYKEWLEEQAIRRGYLDGMVGQLAQDAANADRRAVEAIANTLPSVYAEGANAAAFSIDSAIGMDTSFSLVDQDTVRNLVARQPDMIVPEIPRPAVDAPLDVRWNQQKMTSALTQGILQGESVQQIADRLSSVYAMDEAVALRTARTAVTGAENSGRVSSYKRAQELGIDLMQEWLATLDGRTRNSHRQLDGVKVEVGSVFHAHLGNLEFPGDPRGPAGEVYNCRCTLVAAVKGVDQSSAERWSDLPEGMTYDGWKMETASRGSTPARVPKPEQAPKSGALTNKAIDAMGRDALVRNAREVFMRESAKNGLTAEKAAERFDLLIDGNSNTDLRKYLKRHR